MGIYPIYKLMIICATKINSIVHKTVWLHKSYVEFGSRYRLSGLLKVKYKTDST